MAGDAVIGTPPSTPEGSLKMKKVMARYNLLFLLSALVAQNGITDTPINTFDSNLPDNYFEFSTSDNNNPRVRIYHSIVDNPVNQGSRISSAGIWYS